MYILFFITHKTLSLENCELTFSSISLQSKLNKFDKMYIYNTQPDELLNVDIITIYNKYNLNEYFKELSIFNYDLNSEKTLGKDISNICEYCFSNYNLNDRVLFLKSDCCLSSNYFDEIFNIPLNIIDVYFTSPFICAKKRVPNNEILDYIKRDAYIPSDEITFFVEDRFQSNNNDFNNRLDTSVYDHNIKFFSCYVIRDWSVHLISVSLLNRLIIRSQSWGGVNLSQLENYFIETNRCFTVHKYHNVISENRNVEREGPVEGWLLS
jgi:hypothetical protein